MKTNPRPTFALIAAALLFVYINFTYTPKCVADRPYPRRPITNTVVWGAGGGTDTINRLIMAEMAKTLGVRINVTNRTGGIAGSIGMRHVFSKRADGYNLVGISESNVTAAVNGGWSQKFNVWSPFIVGGSPDLISVRADSPYQSLDALIQAAKKAPFKIKAAAGGSGSIHHLNLLALIKGTEARFKFIPYLGSAPSQTAAMTGEVDLVITSLAEQASLIKGKKLRPLAMLTASDYDMRGHGKIVSAFSSYPQLNEYLPINQAIGFAIRNDAPNEVKMALTKAFEKAMQSATVTQWSQSNYYLLSGKHGQEASKIFTSLESLFAWTLHELGAARYSPDKFKIVKP